MGEASVTRERTEIHVLTGPTAVGKTDAAIAWAEAHDAEILSCDSICVYRGMDVGSAKPTREQRSLVRHHGIDLADPTERFSVTRYVECARQSVQAAAGRGRRILVTGGSGFYLAAFFGPVADEVEIPPVVSQEVRRLFNSGLESLLARLRGLESAPLPEWLDIRNPIRVAKALERRLSSGRPLTELREAFLTRPGPFEGCKITYDLLDRPDDELRRRIAFRTKSMLSQGLIEEAEWLLSLNLNPELPSARAVGYRATMDWLERGRRLPREALAERINLDTWALVRKQRKWFNRLGLSNS
ncbi:MAG: tRNA (adenosine(37)-N6)-dimethylallyltransferase MiaA [Verrucomicrobia bacterium]|nr:tRNA (adenosine(37)-N6)-dimethylallyltransferase MiaA [Verrucomicrobiota bacterium]